MGTYRVPEDYDYLTGGFLKTDEDDKIIPGQLTPNTLNHLLFGTQIKKNNPNHPKNIRKREKNKKGK